MLVQYKLILFNSLNRIRYKFIRLCCEVHFADYLPIYFSMGYKKNIALCLFITYIGMADLLAQNAVVTAGGDASGNGGSVSFSIGQPFYVQLNGSDGSISQGVQQPYEVQVVTDLNHTQGIQLNMSVFPNPTTDFLTLTLGNHVSSNFEYFLYDINGKLIENKSITENNTAIDMKSYHSSIYFLKVLQNSLEVKVFKIIKF